MNSTNLIGRLTKDLEIRYTGNGKAVVNFTVAVDRPFSRDKTDFIECVAWEKTAENMSQYLKKGSQVGVTGYITTRNYENKQGQKVYVTEVLADRVQFLDSKNDNQGDQQQQSQKPRQQTQPKQSDNPFANVEFGSGDPFESNGDVTSISDDDLPF